MCGGGAMPITGAAFGNPTYQSAIGPTPGTGAPMGKLAPMLTFEQSYALSSGFSGIAKGLAAFKQAKAQKQSLMLQAEVQQANARIIAQQLKDEKTISKKERDAIRRKYKRIKEGIAPAAAANNLLIGGGSPLDALLGADIYEKADIGTAKVNEAGRVFGLEVKKFNADAQGDILESTAARISPGFDAASTLLADATSKAFKYYTYKTSRIRGITTFRNMLGLQ